MGLNGSSGVADWVKHWRSAGHTTINATKSKEDSMPKEERNWEYTNKDKSFSHWAKRGNRFYPINATHNLLPKGVYEAKADSDGQTFAREIDFPADTLLSLPGTPTEYIVGQIKDFWDRRKTFERIGFLFKRGILLYGPAGCGKTCIIRQLCDEIIKRDGIVMSINDINIVQDVLLKLREIEPDRPVMTIFEDIEKMMENRDERSDILSFLDGEKQLSNIVHVATTNTPDVLEDCFMRRPGRFDLVLGLDPPIDEAREMYLTHLIKDAVTPEVLQQMVKDTDGMGLAHLRELVVSILCLNLDYKTTLQRLKGNISDEFRMPKVGQKSNKGYTFGFASKKES
jgi:hypothetical protein